MNKEEKRRKKLEFKKLELNYYKVAKRGFEESKKLKVAPKDYIISLNRVNKIYPNYVQAVFDFSLDIKPKEFIVFVGPSGCGKSTTLRMIAGLEEITAGDLYINGKYANDIEPKNRNISMVFQSYALYPNMTVRENLAFGLKILRLSKSEINERVERAAKILEIDSYLDRKPSALSGGQRQRVALGRAIVKSSPVFLMDEPLSNLDAKLRIQMRSEIVSLHNRIGSTTVYVTHDQTEAMTMADRIVVMNKGYVQQIGTPEEVYSNPSNLFVATFIGAPAMNVCDATFVKDKIMFANGFEISLEKSRITKIHNFIKNQISLYKAKVDEYNQLIHKRKLFIASKAERFNVLSLEKLEKKYSKTENKIRTNIANLTAALDIEEDKDAIKEGICELQTSLDKLLLEKENRLQDIETKYRALLANETIDMEAYAEVFEKDEELNVYNNEISSFEEKIAYYSNALNKKELAIVFGIRPEDIKPDICPEAKEYKSPTFNQETDLVELLGYEYYLYYKFNNVKFISKANIGKHKFKAGESLTYSFDLDKMHAFDKDSELILF